MVLPDGLIHTGCAVTKRSPLGASALRFRQGGLHARLSSVCGEKTLRETPAFSHSLGRRPIRQAKPLMWFGPLLALWFHANSGGGGGADEINGSEGGGWMYNRGGQEAQTEILDTTAYGSLKMEISAGEFCRLL
jgi:hypothetical protein